MKLRYLIVCLFYVFLIYRCSSDSEAPTVSITEPQEGDTISICVTDITASADDNDEIEYVAFYVDNALLGTDSVSPYAQNWSISGLNDLSNHSLYATAYDLSENSTQSDVIVVTVITRGLVSGVNSDTVLIFDGTYALSDITISDAPDSAVVDSVGVIATILHQEIDDVDVYLQSPTGTEQQLWDNDFSSPTDTATTVSFINEEINGTWLLRVYDEDNNGLGGYITNFTLEIYWKF